LEVPTRVGDDTGDPILLLLAGGQQRKKKKKVSILRMTVWGS
jgi:hypothetical protein